MQPAPLPPDAVRSRALAALVLSNFLMWGGFFLIVPLLSVHYVAGLGWSAGAVGTVLAVRQLTQQGLTVFGGALADRLGARGLIVAGLAIRAVGFAMMGPANGFWALMLASVVAGVGGALFDAPKNAAVTTLTTPESRSRVFSVMGVSGNVGMVVGPLVGALLNSVSFALVALVAGSVYLVALALVAATLPGGRGAGETRGKEAGLAGLGVVVRDRRFVTFTALAAGYFVLSTQLNVAVTLRATELHGAGAVGWVYGVNAGLAVLLQYPLLRLAERHLSAKRIFVTGVVLVSLGLGGLAFAGAFWTLLACVAVFSAGSMLTFPTQQALTARLARPGLYGAYFGFGALSLGVGGAVGNAIGGLLYDAGRSLGQPALPWLSFAALGALTALGLALQLRGLPREEPGAARAG